MYFGPNIKLEDFSKRKIKNHQDVLDFSEAAKTIVEEIAVLAKQINYLKSEKNWIEFLLVRINHNLWDECGSHGEHIQISLLEIQEDIRLILMEKLRLRKRKLTRQAKFLSNAVIKSLKNRIR